MILETKPGISATEQLLMIIIINTNGTGDILRISILYTVMPCSLCVYTL